MTADWKSLINTVAPTLGAALDGPLASVAMTCISRAISLPEETTEVDFIKALKNLTPEQLVEIKKTDAEFEGKMAELKLDVKKFVTPITSSEQGRGGSHPSDTTTPKYLAVGAILMFFGILIVSGIMLFLPEGINKDAIYFLGAVQGATITLIQTVYSYYLGNNSESGIRDQMIYHSQPMARKSDKLGMNRETDQKN